MKFLLYFFFHICRHYALLVNFQNMKLILIRFSYGLFLVIMQKTCTCTPIYFSVSCYDIPRCVPKHYFSINIIFLFPNCWSGAEMPCRMQKIESGLLTFTVFEMLRKTKKKKPLQLMGKSEKAQINEWMNEKHVAAKVEETSKLSVGTIDWSHV